MSALPAAPARRRETVVLLHSSASSAVQWNALVEDLDGSFDVHTVEFHGHGDRPAWQGERPMRLADEAALVRPLLEAAGGGHLLGHSYGGAVALHLAATVPALVRSVAAFEPVLFRLLIDHLPDDGVTRRAIQLGESMRVEVSRGERLRAAERFVDHWSGVGGWRQLPSHRQQSVARRVDALVQQFDALFNEPRPLAAVAEARCPMLMLDGAATVTTARVIAALLRLRLPQALHETLPEMGHMGPITHPRAVNARFAAFLHAQARYAPTLRNSSRSGAKLA